MHCKKWKYNISKFLFCCVEKAHGFRVGEVGVRIQGGGKRGFDRGAEGAGRKPQVGTDQGQEERGKVCLNLNLKTTNQAW